MSLASKYFILPNFKLLCSKTELCTVQHIKPPGIAAYLLHSLHFLHWERNNGGCSSLFFCTVNPAAIDGPDVANAAAAESVRLKASGKQRLARLL